MSERVRCEVCDGEEDDARLLSNCFECARDFHLNPRSDVEGIDCGDAWIGPSLGVHFYCQRCIDEMDGRVRASLGDPALAQAAMMAQQMGGGMFEGLPGSAPAAAEPPATHGDAPPPRSQRPRRRRRYRRIDRP